MKHLDFSTEQYMQIETLAGIGYSPVNIAVFLETDVKLFVKLSNDPKSAIAKAISRGSLQAEYEVNNATLTSAKSGNLTATQRLDKLRYTIKVEEAKKRIFYED